MAVTATHLANAGSATDASSYAVASFTLAANSLGLLAVANSHGTAATLPTITDANRTWTQVDTVTWNGGARRVTLFRTLNGSQTIGGATIDFGGTTQTGCDHSADAFAGVDTSGTNGSGAIVQVLPNSGTTGLTLVVTLAGFASTDNATYGTFSHNVSQAETAGSGFSALANSNHALPNTGFIAEWRADNDTTVDATWATSAAAGGIGAELKAAGAGSSSATGALTLPTLTASGTTTAQTAAAGAAVLPALTGSGTTTSASACDGAFTLSALTATSTTTSTSATTATVVLPPLTASGTTTSAAATTGALVVPPLTASAATTSVSTSAGALTLPALTVSGTTTGDDGSVSTIGSLVLPALAAAGTSTSSHSPTPRRVSTSTARRSTAGTPRRSTVATARRG